jgi:hypothetical protein
MSMGFESLVLVYANLKALYFFMFHGKAKESAILLLRVKFGRYNTFEFCFFLAIDLSNIKGT